MPTFPAEYSIVAMVCLEDVDEFVSVVLHLVVSPCYWPRNGAAFDGLWIFVKAQSPSRRTPLPLDGRSGSLCAPGLRIALMSAQQAGGPKHNTSGRSQTKSRPW